MPDRGSPWRRVSRLVQVPPRVTLIPSWTSYAERDPGLVALAKQFAAELATRGSISAAILHGHGDRLNAIA